MNQLGFPSVVSALEVTRKKSLGGAIDLCREAADLEPKQVKVTTSEGKAVDKAAWSRWVNDQEGIEWAKLVQIMDACGNDAPLLWMLHDRGFDLSSLRRMETNLEKENRLLREELEQVKSERAVELRLIRDIRVAA